VSGILIFGIFVVVAFVVLGLVIVLVDSFGGKGVRRKQYDLMKQQRNLAYDAIEAIDTACQEYKEIDHPVVSKITPLISEFKSEEWKLRK
jgi:hypothetical protein